MFGRTKKCDEDTDGRCLREEKENTAGSRGLTTFKHLVIMNLRRESD